MVKVALQGRSSIRPCAYLIDVHRHGMIDLMTNASRMDCLPEQGSAYWDAALVPTQAALNGIKTGIN